eukprot:gene33192-40158_t
MRTALILLTLCVSCVAAIVPNDWQAKVASYNAFFAENDDGALVMDGFPKGVYLPLIGNGYLSHAKGVRSDTMYVSGIFNGETTSPSHRAAMPALYAVTVDDSTTTGVLLDVSTGTYHRRGTLSGHAVSYELRWYAHRTRKNLYVLEMDLNSAETTNVSINLSTNVLQKSPDISFATLPAPLANVGLQCGETLIPETTDGPTHKVCMAYDVLPASLPVSPGSSALRFVMSVYTSLDSSTTAKGGDYIMAGAMDALTATRKLSRDELYAEHVQGWQELQASGVEVRGRGDVAAAINASVYAILSSVRADWPYGLAPGGLTNYYNGHSFWDTETWMYPPLLFTHSFLARALLQYRFDRLDGARQKAQSYSPPFSGTMFPWESAFSGVETCPSWAATGQREDHISGDIALAAWQFWLMSGDVDWLRTVGYPLLEGISDFWVSRSTLESATSTYHINGVIPPDEYVDHVNDSVYTNYVARLALQATIKAAAVLNTTCDRCATYQAVAEGLVMLFDETLQVHPEYAGYPGNLVKQADVVLLHYPLGMEMPASVQLNDLEYYSSRTDPKGPAMTWGMHCVGYLDLQQFDRAAQFFNMSFQDNMHAPLMVWTETPEGNAVNFITGAGGFLQTMIMGYPGLRIDDQGLNATPACIPGATFIKLRSVQYQGSTFDLEYECDGVSPVPVDGKMTMAKQGKSPMRMQWFNRDEFRMMPMVQGESLSLLDRKMRSPHGIRIVRA